MTVLEDVMRPVFQPLKALTTGSFQTSVKVVANRLLASGHLRCSEHHLRHYGELGRRSLSVPVVITPLLLHPIYHGTSFLFSTHYPAFSHSSPIPMNSSIPHPSQMKSPISTTGQSSHPFPHYSPCNPCLSLTHPYLM